MHAAERFEFAPPAPPGLLRALGLAMLAHLLLLAALTWGVSWKRDAQTPAVEAELWSSIPQQAAPKLVEVPPEPEPAPAPPPPKAEPVVSNADIALAREKERKAKEKLELDKLQKEKQALEKKRQQDKLEQDKKAAEEKKKKEKELEAQKKDQLKSQEDAKKLEKLRQENLKRMAGLAGATGNPSATGSALKSAGPSASYAGRIIGRVKPNIVFTEDIVGNPSAEVEVRTAPDGTIIGRKLLKPSGIKAWDEAVLKAIDKTEVLPRDVDGRVPPTLVITFRPRD